MKTSTKRILITSAVLAFTGAVLTGAGFLLGGRPGVVFNKYGISSPYKQYEPFTMEKTKLNTYSNLNLQIDSMADVDIQPSEDDNYYVEYLLDGEYGEPVCKVENDTLTLSQKDSATHMGIGIFGFVLDRQDDFQPYIKLYVPQKEVLKQVDIYNDYGDLSISDIEFENAAIEADFGDITLKHVASETLDLVLDSGYLKTEDLTVSDFTLESGFGDADLKNTSLKNADFVLETGTLIWDTAELDHMTCQAEYGTVHLYLPAPANTYQFDINLELGTLVLPEDSDLGRYKEDYGEVSYQTSSTSENADKKISIDSESGDVIIEYSK